MLWSALGYPSRSMHPPVKIRPNKSAPNKKSTGPDYVARYWAGRYTASNIRSNFCIGYETRKLNVFGN
ncbi:unnamed protein product [Nezara viridula]|uniref:Uncharacterized protein n=1 Tax=Nezara viridula TaxID=85310 RepID=A0A9P0E7H1_NEZVI|nr:unnamed protein product [Nezara viridula]